MARPRAARARRPRGRRPPRRAARASALALEGLDERGRRRARRHLRRGPRRRGRSPSTRSTRVFHLAAQTLVGHRQPLAALDLRDQRPRHLDAAGGVPRCTASRAWSWPPRTRPTAASDELPYREDQPLAPRFPYDVCKAAADLIARSYWHTFGLPVAVTRFANLYGGGDLNRSRLVPEAVGAALAGRAPVIRSDGSPERDFLYVEDAVGGLPGDLADALDAARRAAARRSTPAAARPHAVRDVVELICRAGRHATSTPDDPRDRHAARRDRPPVGRRHQAARAHRLGARGRASRRACGARSTGIARTRGRWRCSHPPIVSRHVRSFQMGVDQAQEGGRRPRRGQHFTKLARAITVAAREGGGDPDGNPALALAVQKARDASMPKDNIERAIAKGTGEGVDADQIETVLYEGYGPGGVALLIEALTDNRNRTGADVRHAAVQARRQPRRARLGLLPVRQARRDRRRRLALRRGRPDGRRSTPAPRTSRSTRTFRDRSPSRRTWRRARRARPAPGSRSRAPT